MAGEVAEAGMYLLLAPDVSLPFRQKLGHFTRTFYTYPEGLGFSLVQILRALTGPRLQNRQIVLPAPHCGCVWTLVVPFLKGSGENSRESGLVRSP